VPLTRVAQLEHRPLRTLRAWVSRYHRQGLAGLARQPRADRGQRRRVTTELQQLIEGLALKRPPPTAALIHRQLSQLAPEHGWTMPSYRTVAAIVARLDPAFVTLAHDGAVAYRETFDLLYRREADCPNAIWQADHTPLDIWVRDGDGKPVRPWFTVILDDYSRAVAAYRVSTQAPSALQTALTLREAIWRKSDPRWQICGIPGTFYTDHGSDFTSRHLEQVGADLKMVLVFSEAGKPRGRGRIERFFRTVNQLCLSTLPGYIARGAAHPAPTLTLAELAQRLQTFLLTDYNHAVHGETGVTPHARWEEGGFLPQLPESLEQLDLLLLMVAKPRRVQQDGIHFEGLRYLDLTLAAYVGESVVIRYDPKDLGEIRVFYHNRFLCRAVCQELADQVIGLAEIVQARTQRRRAVGDTLRQRATVVETALALHPAETPAPAEPAPARSRLKRYLND
jgi:putative transposase